jgi:hypothetical protein
MGHAPGSPLGPHNLEFRLHAIDTGSPTCYDATMQVDTRKMREAADAELAAAKTTHTEKIRAIEAIERLFGNGEEKRQEAKRPPAPQPKPQNGALALRAEIVNALRPKGVAGGTLQDIANYVAASPHRESKEKVARILYKMHKAGVIRMIRKQLGPVPALYALPLKEGSH